MLSLTLLCLRAARRMLLSLAISRTMDHVKHLEVAAFTELLRCNVALSIISLRGSAPSLKKSLENLR